jgi:purine-binding chemotaxis protein CheW
MTELFLIAHVADRGVAVLADQVDSVIDIGAIVPVPRTAPAVRGLAALRSRVVTVIDTRIALGLAPTGEARRAIIARLDGHHYAFLVDSLEDVASFVRLAAATAPTAGQGWGAAAAGLIERDGEPLLVLDLAALIPDPFAPDPFCLAA